MPQGYTGLQLMSLSAIHKGNWLRNIAMYVEQREHYLKHIKEGIFKLDVDDEDKFYVYLLDRSRDDSM
jgi:hypothetical protein